MKSIYKLLKIRITGKFLNIKMICRMLLGYCITVAVKGEFVQIIKINKRNVFIFQKKIKNCPLITSDKHKILKSTQLSWMQIWRCVQSGILCLKTLSQIIVWKFFFFNDTMQNIILVEYLGLLSNNSRREKYSMSW